MAQDDFKRTHPNNVQNKWFSLKYMLRKLNLDILGETHLPECFEGTIFH
jgi:hypothetical protein